MVKETNELATSHPLNQDELEQINGGRPGGQPIADMPLHKVPVWYTDPETGDSFWLC